jgi:hypothetical protein
MLYPLKGGRILRRGLLVFEQPCLLLLLQRVVIALEPKRPPNLAAPRECRARKPDQGVVYSYWARQAMCLWLWGTYFGQLWADKAA